MGGGHFHVLGKERCTCRECHPGRSGGVFVLAEDAAEAVTSMDATWRADQSLEWPDIGNALVRAVGALERVRGAGGTTEHTGANMRPVADPG
jgi:hypothetical protein